MCLVLTDGQTEIFFDQRDLLIGKIISLSLSASSFNYNIIGLEAFRLTILFYQLRFYLIHIKTFILKKMAINSIREQLEFENMYVR